MKLSIGTAGLLIFGSCLFLRTDFAQPSPPAHPYPRIDDTIGYKADPGWPREKPPGGEWNAPMSSVALGPDGNVWTFNRGKIPVQVYTQDGRLVKYWGQGGLFRNPHTIRFDGAGNLWIVDTLTQTIRRFTPDGKVLLTVGTPDVPGEDETHMNQPNDVAIAPNGDLYVSDGYGNNRVVVFDKNGKFIRAWGKLGTGPGEFSQPHSLVLDSKGRVYVADRNNSRIQVFDSKGKFLTEWRNIVTPWALAITKTDEIYVCGSSPMLWSEIPATQSALATPPKDQLFLKLDTEGRLKQLWVFPKGDKPGELDWAHSVAVAPDGSLYFAEVMAKRAQKFVPAGSQAKQTLSSIK
jgi:DNA-binding beta-propeller fold protein YncE